MWQSKQRDSVTAAVAQKSTAGGFHCVGLWAGGAVRRPTQCGSRRYPRCGPWAGRARGGSHQPFSLALPPSPPACAMGRGGGAVRWECEKKGTADGDGQVASPAQGPAQKCPRCQSPSGASTLGRAHRWQPGQGTQGAQQGSFAMRARGRERAGEGRGGAPGSGEPWIACGGARARIAMARTAPAPAPVSAHDRWWSGGGLRTQARQHRREGGPRRDGGTPTVHAAVPRHISCCVTGTRARARPDNESRGAPVAIHGVRQTVNCLPSRETPLSFSHHDMRRKQRKYFSALLVL